MSSQLFVLLAVCLAAVTANDLCESDGNGKFKGILRDSNGDLLLLKGENYWKLTGNFNDGFSVVDGYPKKIASYWTGFPRDVDIEKALYISDVGISLLQEGDQIWAFNGRQLRTGYPKDFDEGRFTDSAIDNDAKNRIMQLYSQYDAVADLPSGGGQQIFTFKGTKFSKYTPDWQILSGYPKDVVPYWFQCADSSDEE